MNPVIKNKSLCRGKERTPLFVASGTWITSLVFLFPELTVEEKVVGKALLMAVANSAWYHATTL